MVISWGDVQRTALGLRMEFSVMGTKGVGARMSFKEA